MSETQNSTVTVSDIAVIATGPTDTTTPVQKTVEDGEKQADGRHRRHMRVWVAFAVVGILSLELGGMFILVILQGFGEMTLNEWMFGFLTNGILLQTFLGFRNIIAHLFPVEGGVLPGEKK